MKKYFGLVILIFIFILTSCSNQITLNDNYNNDSIEEVSINKDKVKIMQLTDLHLTYGFDFLDKKTYKMISALILSEKPDLIVVTGDLFMSIKAKSILTNFISFMEKNQTPWTLTFGNHEREYHKIETIVNILMNSKTTYLRFHYGPKLSKDNTHGFSNFKIKINSKGIPFLNIYLLDSKDTRKDGVKDPNFPYDYVSDEQVKWYEEEVKIDTVKSLMFIHMPLIEYLDYVGTDINEKIWPQGKNTGLFDAILNNGKTLGVFVGHDHTNEFSFYKDGIMLAYGRNSGYNAYGLGPKGARIIEFDINGILSSYLVGDPYE